MISPFSHTPQKNGNSQMKGCDIFHIFAQKIDRGYTLDEYPQSMF